MYNNDNNNEILIKHKPLVYTRAWHAVQEKKKRLGQYNSHNKLIHGQYTSRYNLHLSLSLSLPPSLSLSLSLSHTHTHTHTHTHRHTHHTASQMT